MLSGNNICMIAKAQNTMKNTKNPVPGEPQPLWNGIFICNTFIVMHYICIPETHAKSLNNLSSHTLPGIGQHEGEAHKRDEERHDEVVCVVGHKSHEQESATSHGRHHQY